MKTIENNHDNRQQLATKLIDSFEEVDDIYSLGTQYLQDVYKRDQNQFESDWVFFFQETKLQDEFQFTKPSENNEDNREFLIENIIRGLTGEQSREVLRILLEKNYRENDEMFFQDWTNAFNPERNEHDDTTNTRTHQSKD